MATFFDNAVVTNAGKELLQKSQQGLTGIQLTGFGLGSGVWDTSEESLAEATALKSVKNTYTISSSTVEQNGDLSIKGVFVNAVSGTSIVTTDYDMTELGLYAKDDQNNTVLYAIGVPTGDADTMPVYTGGNLVQIEETFTLSIGDAEVTVDYNGAFALAADLDALETVVAGKGDSLSYDSATRKLKLKSGSSVLSEETLPDKADNISWDNETKTLKLKSGSTELDSEVIDTGAGGSVISITTEESSLYGKDVTLSIGGETYTETIDNSGTATFDNVMEIGTGTITASDGVDTDTETISIPYFGSYSVELILGTVYTINITTSETTLYGQTATITNGSDTKTVTIGSSGTVTTRIKFTGSVTISASDGVHTAEKTITVSSGTSEYNVTLSFVQIYGVSWDGTSTTAWTRTDASINFTDPSPAVNNGNGSSPFDDLYPWSEMERVTDAEAGTLVKIPKFYYKWTRSGNTMKLQIADGEVDGFHISPAHADRGDGSGERDVVYVGAYHCATSTYKSTTGVKPQASKTRSEFRSSISGLGSKVWQWDYAMLWTIQMLYLVEFADWNSQAKIGYGCGNNSATENMGSTDAMTYHTGTNAANRTTYGHIRYRWIEGLWDNVYDWCDGIYFSGSDVYCIKNPSSFSDSSGGTKVGTRATSGGYTSKYTDPSASGFEYALYPSEVSGTDSTYVCDYCDYSASGVVLRVGGSYDQGQNRGLFYLSGYDAASYQYASIGSRLQKLP